MIDTHSTYVAGYVATTLVYVLYIVSLAIRSKRVQEKLKSVRTSRSGASG